MKNFLYKVVQRAELLQMRSTLQHLTQRHPTGGVSGMWDCQASTPLTILHSHCFYTHTQSEFLQVRLDHFWFELSSTVENEIVLPLLYYVRGRWENYKHIHCSLFWWFFFQRCFVGLSSGFTVSEDAEIEPVLLQRCYDSQKHWHFGLISNLNLKKDEKSDLA
jgi:hypothetical protein